MASVSLLAERFSASDPEVPQHVETVAALVQTFATRFAKHVWCFAFSSLPLNVARFCFVQHERFTASAPEVARPVYRGTACCSRERAARFARHASMPQPRRFLNMSGPLQRDLRFKCPLRLRDFVSVSLFASPERFSASVPEVPQHVQSDAVCTARIVEV